MVRYEFVGIFHSGLVGRLVLAAMKQQVVAHTTANEALLDAWQGVNSTIYVEQFGVVGVEVWANLRMNA